MSMNRIQFQHGISLPEFLKQYGTEAQCEAALEQVRWPQGFICPYCGESHCSIFKLGSHNCTSAKPVDIKPRSLPTRFFKKQNYR
jgi:hypothetical protein